MFLDIVVFLPLLKGDLDHPTLMSKYKLSSSSHNYLSQKKGSLSTEPSANLLLQGSHNY